MNTRAAAKRRYLPSSPFQAPPEAVVEQYSVDDRVAHDEYGLGRVVTLEEAAVTVDFGSQTIRITSPFRKLTKL